MQNPRLPLGDRPVRYAETQAAGIPRSALRSSDIAHPHHGVYDLEYDTTDLVQRCRRLLPVLGPARWFSHLTAARLWGMPLPWPYRDDEPLHVVAVAPAGRLRRPGVVGWESNAPLPWALADAIPVIAPAEVWCQLAVPGATGRDGSSGLRSRLTEHALVAVADHLLSGPRRPAPRRALCSHDDLAAALRRRTAGRGTLAIEAALARARHPVDSPRETALRLSLVDHGLPEPEVQLGVDTAAGLRHADLGYRGARVLIEYHGDHHRTDQRQWREDATRRQLFEDAGYRLLEATVADLGDGGRALAARVRRALRGAVFSR